MGYNGNAILFQFRLNAWIEYVGEHEASLNLWILCVSHVNFTCRKCCVNKFIISHTTAVNPRDLRCCCCCCLHCWDMGILRITLIGFPRMKLLFSSLLSRLFVRYGLTWLTRFLAKPSKLCFLGNDNIFIFYSFPAY